MDTKPQEHEHELEQVLVCDQIAHVVQSLEEAPEEARMLASRARTWAYQHLSTPALYHYMRVLLTKYAALQRFRPSPSAAEGFRLIGWEDVFAQVKRRPLSFNSSNAISSLAHQK